MTVTVLGLLSPLLAVLIHALTFTWLPERVRFLAIPFFDAVALAAVGMALSSLGFTPTGSEWLLAGVLTLSLSFAYALILIGIVADSPTLALVNTIADYGAGGMPLSMLDEFVRAHPFLESRTVALLRSGVLRREGGLLVLRGKVGMGLRLGEAYRRLCRRGAVAG